MRHMPLGWRVRLEHEAIAARHRRKPAAHKRRPGGKSERLTMMERDVVCSWMKKRIADRAGGCTVRASLGDDAERNNIVTPSRHWRGA
jgi:hypothetical protein